jgi:hypothetical protein
MREVARALQRFAVGHAALHAERASAAVRSALASHETIPDAVETSATSTPGPEPAPLRDAAPDPLPQWVEKRQDQPLQEKRSQRGILVVAGGAALLLGVIGAWIARPAPEPHAVASPTAASAAPVASAGPTAPVATAEIASVPFDQLPVAARDAGKTASASSTPSAPPRKAAPTPGPSHRAAAPPAPTPPPAGSNKDDWKWGDRN